MRTSGKSQEQKEKLKRCRRRQMSLLHVDGTLFSLLKGSNASPSLHNISLSLCHISSWLPATQNTTQYSFSINLSTNISLLMIPFSNRGKASRSITQTMCNNNKRSSLHYIGNLVYFPLNGTMFVRKMLLWGEPQICVAVPIKSHLSLLSI